jgi:hypothetical protein
MGQHYPSDIKERALAIAKLIREIPDETERRQTARAVCLQAVTGNPSFPEELFLRDCGIRLDLRQGKSLRVKKSKHTVRTCEEHERFVSQRHTSEQQRRGRLLRGETEQPADLDVVISPWSIRRPVRSEDSHANALIRMY